MVRSLGKPGASLYLVRLVVAFIGFAYVFLWISAPGILDFSSALTGLADDQAVSISSLSDQDVSYIKRLYAEDHEHPVPDVGVFGNHVVQSIAAEHFLPLLDDAGQRKSFFNYFSPHASLDDVRLILDRLQAVGRLPRVMVIGVTHPHHASGGHYLGYQYQIDPLYYDFSGRKGPESLLARLRETSQGLFSKMQWTNILHGITVRAGISCKPLQRISRTRPEDDEQQEIKAAWLRQMIEKFVPVRICAQRVGLIADGSQVGQYGELKAPPPYQYDPARHTGMGSPLRQEQIGELAALIKSFGRYEANGHRVIFVMMPRYLDNLILPEDEVFSAALERVKPRDFIDLRNMQDDPENFMDSAHTSVRLNRHMAERIRERLSP